MIRWLKRLILTVAAVAMGTAAVFAQDTGAITSGNWEDSSIWTSGTVPGSSNNVYIGSSYPTGSATTATVTLTASESAANVYLGDNSSFVPPFATGTLNLGNNSLAIAGALYFGSGGGTAILQEGAGGSFTAQSAYVDSGNTLNFGAHDAVSSLQITNNSVVTTAASGNVTGSVTVGTGSTLNLGANLNLSNFGTLAFGSPTLPLGTGATLNMNGYSINAYQVFLGYYGGGNPVTIENQGTLTAGYLTIGGGTTYNLLASDSVSNFYVGGGTSTLNSNVSYLELTSGSVTTTATGSVTGGADVYGGTLNLGANLSLGNYGSLTVEGFSSTLNMNGHSVNAYQVDLGYYQGSGINLENRGTITATYLYAGNTTFNLNATDSVTNFYLTNAASMLNSGVSYVQLSNFSVATTTPTGSVTGSADVYSGSTLNLGANLNLSNNLTIQDGSTVDAHHFGITSNEILLGWSGTSSASLLDTGLVQTNALYMSHGSLLTLHGGDVVNNLIDLTNNSVLTVQQTNGIGLTFNGTLASSLAIDPSQMDLIFTLNNGLNWDFRWLDPSGGGNWVSTLESMIAGGEIVITAPQGYFVSDQNGYTYIASAGQGVPEPSALVLAAIATMGVIVGAKWARRRTGHREALKGSSGSLWWRPNASLGKNLFKCSSLAVCCLNAAPREPWRTPAMRRFLVLLVALVLVSGGLGPAKADNVLLLSTGYAAEDNSVVNLLEADGHTVTVGPYYESYQGSNLSGYTSVILLENVSTIGGEIPAAGQTALVNYVAAGGGLLTGEWTVWAIAGEGFNQILKTVLPVIPSSAFNYNSPITYSLATPDPVLNSGLPSSFSFNAEIVGGTETYFQPQPGATVFYGSSFGGTPPGDGVIGWQYGSGRVMSFSTLAAQEELADPNYGTLFSNGVNWVEDPPTGTQSVPEPAALTLLGIGALGLMIHRLRSRKGRGRREGEEK